MYEYLRGQLVELNSSHAVVDVCGVGYRVGVPMSYLSKGLSLGQEVILHTSWVVRENGWALYGFVTKEERELFDLLIGISGVGPKTAISIIGHLGPSALHDAIHRGDLFTLAKVPGIGKKTAERLIIELRGKIDDLVVAPTSGSSRTVQDALHALLNLGYSHASAKAALDKAMQEVPPESDLSLLLATALKNK